MLSRYMPDPASDIKIQIQYINKNKMSVNAVVTDPAVDRQYTYHKNLQKSFQSTSQYLLHMKDNRTTKSSMHVNGNYGFP